MSETASRTVTIAGHVIELQRKRIERTMKTVLPDPVQRHFVVIGGRRYPPKQVISQVTGLDRADFTTHQARRILIRLGFAAGRRAARTGRRTPGTGRNRSADDLSNALRLLTGKWVATAGEDVLVSADTPHEVLEWLSRHDRRADSMFRVPENEAAASGLAPR